MRLGGFVIHGNSAATLATCLDSLNAVCDEVAAVDSGSDDGSRALAADRGARRIEHPWEGYGAARRVAVDALRRCDYLFFLDADERLEPESIAALQRWRASDPHLPQYTVRRRDWATLDGRRFVFRTETRTRLVRSELATWQPSWIVHEALPRRTSAPAGAYVEHAFASSLEEVRTKQARYAFLWAVRAHAEGAPARSGSPRELANFLRDGVLKGALWRGGRAGWRLARTTAEYHRLKYEYLRDLQEGRFVEAARAYKEARYGDLFRLVAGGPPLG